MPAIEHMLKRMGYVRLSKYGLVLTPEGRIMSLRPVLDDGTGGQVVGWRDKDLAAAELQRWEPARPAPRGAVAAPVATPPRVSAPVAVQRPIAPIPPPSVPVPQAYVAPAEEPEEDEWEWEIALARARVAAEEIEAAVIPPQVKFDTKTEEYKFETETKPYIEQPKFITAKTLPIATVATKHEEITAEWPKTEPLKEIDFERSDVIARPPTMIPPRRPHATPAPVPTKPQFPRAKSPSTVIPIPKLPRVTNQNTTQSLEPVVRRFPKATPAPVTSLGIAPPPPIRAAEDDKTSPGFLPPAASAVALPRIPGVIKR